MSAVMTNGASALREGYWLCLVCEQLQSVPNGHDAPCCCCRCGAKLDARKPASLARSTAWLAAAASLYIPANTLPVIQSGTVFGFQSDTIMSGVLHLWRTGSMMLAAILFIASIIVPLVKLLSLGYLIVTAYCHSSRNPRARTVLYRMTAYIGRWSMVDVYVAAVLVALVQFKAFGRVEPSPGAIAFSAVVVFTMLASLSFDPRLSWDGAERSDG
jgi:paraquat-inducible protein A